VLPGERVNAIDVTNFTGAPQQLREVALAAKAITVRQQRKTVRLAQTVRPPKPLKRANAADRVVRVNVTGQLPQILPSPQIGWR
jgi:hypothetical protein